MPVFFGFYLLTAPAHAMSIFVKHGIRCLFVHIPKTGGTSVEHSLRAFGWFDPLIVRAQTVKELRYLKATPQHFHADLLEALFRWEEINLAFAICRHPFDRMKSEYYWQLNKALAPDSRPREWLDAVLKQYAQDPYVYENHLRPQVEFVPAHRELLTFRLEEDGVRKALTRVNALAPASRFQQWAARTFPARLHRSKPSPEAEADFKGLRREIEDFYSQDMAHFGY
jgi:hypothetical protein